MWNSPGVLIVAIAALGTPVYHFRGPPSGISTNLGSAMQSHQDRHRNRLHAGTVTARRNERPPAVTSGSGL